MSDNNNKDSDMSESSVNKILLDDEIQETEGSKIFGQPKESKDTKRKPKRLSTASTQEAGSSSPGKKKKPKIVHNPPDARGEGFVRLDKDTNLELIQKQCLRRIRNLEKIFQGLEIEDRF